MEVDVCELVVCLPGDQYHVCSGVSVGERLSTIGQDVGVYGDFGSFDGLFYSRVAQAILGLDCEVISFEICVYCVDGCIELVMSKFLLFLRRIV